MDLADTANVHQLADTASNLVDKFVPVSFQVCLLLPCMAEPALVNTPMCQHAHCPLTLSALPVLAIAVRKQIRTPKKGNYGGKNKTYFVPIGMGSERAEFMLVCS